MLTTLIRRELLDNLMTFRFAAAVFVMLLLVVANTAVLLKDYERRLADYNTAVEKSKQNLRKTKTYSAGELYVNRPPNPLSLFNVGLDKRLGNKIEVSHAFVPSLWDATMHGADNPLLNLFTSIDIVFIFEVVLSLLALIFAYDAIAGESERGTLRLMLTHPVRRGQMLLAKYIGAMVCLLVPLLISLLFAVILLTTSPTFSLSMQDFLRIVGIVLSSIAYLSVFYLIGLLISAATRRTGTALMLSMFAWGFLVLVYPNMILAATNRPDRPEERMASDFNRIKQIWKEFDRERKQFLAREVVSFHLPGATGYDFEDTKDDLSILQYYNQSGLHIEALKEEAEPRLPHIQNYHRFLGPRTINTAARTWLIRKPTLEAVFVHPANMDRAWLRLSPVGIYDAATQAWAGTDLNGIQDFFTAIQQHQQAVHDYFFDKKVFGSRQWFAADKGAVDWDVLPQFSFQRSDIGVNAKRALPDVCLLLMVNIVLFAIIFLIFVKSEV